DCQLPTLMGATGDLKTMSINAPKTVESYCSSVQHGNSLIVMSGGVQIASWQAADRTELRPVVAQVREKARPASASTQAWWNPARWRAPHRAKPSPSVGVTIADGQRAARTEQRFGTDAHPYVLHEQPISARRRCLFRALLFRHFARFRRPTNG